MHLSSSINVNYSVKQVWALFADPYFLAKWDRSVAKVITTTAPDMKTGVGFTFDTIAPARKRRKKDLRMSYRIIEYVPEHYTKIQLERSNIFKQAVWKMRVQPGTAGCLITCEVDLIVHPLYFFMLPALFFNKKALLTDMVYLRKAIEMHYGISQIVEL